MWYEILWAFVAETSETAEDIVFHEFEVYLSEENFLQEYLERVGYDGELV